MNTIKVNLHCPHCGKSFDLEMEEDASEDDLIEECPLCGSPIDIRLVLSPDGKVAGAEIQRSDGVEDE